MPRSTSLFVGFHTEETAGGTRRETTKYCTVYLR